MGTRSLTVFRDDDGAEIAVMYRQFDGYPSGHGKELSAFLASHRLVNGFGANDTKDNAFNGMACLAAAVVAHFKTDIGNVYLYPAGTRDCGEEYVYEIGRGLGDTPRIICRSVYGDVTIFDGAPSDFSTVESE